MIICGLDFETTGLSPEKDRVIEIGMVLWDTDSHNMIRTCGELVRSDVKITAEITAINGITEASVEKYGIPQDEALTIVKDGIYGADAVCAHNGTNFDKQFYFHWLKRNNWLVSEHFANDLWIDTCVDLPQPLGKLIYAAADRGFVNPFPHRAVTDVLTMLRILDGYDVVEVARRARIPNVTVQALVSYDNRELARVRGYHWKGETRQWLRTVKEDMVQEELRNAGFKVAVLK